MVVGIATRNPLWEKLLSNVAEVRSRGATVVLVADDGDEESAAVADHVLWVPADHRRCSLPSWAWCRCSSWPTAWPACTATMPTAPATWPRR